MPLLPRNRTRYEQDLAETEERLDRWIQEVDDLRASTAQTHAVVMRTQSMRITALRTSFAAMREDNGAPAT